MIIARRKIHVLYIFRVKSHLMFTTMMNVLNKHTIRWKTAVMKHHTHVGVFSDTNIFLSCERHFPVFNSAECGLEVINLLLLVTKEQQ